jgi:hypothetical protein
LFRHGDAAVTGYGSSIWRQSASEHVQQGGFAATIFTHNADPRRWCDSELDVVQNAVATECGFDGVQRNLGARMRRMVGFERHKKSL